MSTAPVIIKVNKPTTEIKSNLICLHHVGGSGNVFRPLAKSLEPHGIQVYAVSLPGRVPKQANLIIKDCGLIVDQILLAMQNFKSNIENLPLMMFGHSLGQTYFKSSTKLFFTHLHLIILDDIK